MIASCFSFWLMSRAQILSDFGGCALLPFTACGAKRARMAYIPALLPCMRGILEVSLFIMLNR